MDKLLYKKELLGIRIRKLKKGTNPISDENATLQVMSLNFKKGHDVSAHFHEPVQRVTQTLQECIVVLRGKVRVDLYGNGKKVLKKVTIKAGEAFVTMSGGHSVHFLEDSEILETKNGPFVYDKISIAI